MTNTFGTSFKVTTWGESHGKAIGAVIDGCPAGLPLKESDIQSDLDRRKPGQSTITTDRKESDRVEILSGVFEGKTTGTPISLMIMNEDSDPKSYDHLKDVFRPGHADMAYFVKYGHRDHRGGGRSSGRETAARVAAGAIAKKIIDADIKAYAVQIGSIVAKKRDLEEIENNPVRSPDKDAAKKMVAEIEAAKAESDSIGGIIEIIVSAMHAGTGDPIFGKLDSLLAAALMSIGGVKGVEIGSGFSCAEMKGSAHNDQMNKEGFTSNNAGGIAGGISTGQDLIIRIAVKPTSSIGKKQKMISISGEETIIGIEGRHDPCLVPRIVPVAEAMVALVLADRR